jgi:hypothetical protein
MAEVWEKIYSSPARQLQDIPDQKWCGNKTKKGDEKK